MIEKNNIPIYILCGGKSSRMQTDKGLVNFKDKPFIQWVIDAAKNISNRIFLVTNNSDYQNFGYPLISDIYKDKGPVGGIFSALKHAQSNKIMVLSCDIPNIKSEILQNFLLNNVQENLDILMLSDQEKIYPLIGIYSKSVMDGFENAIKTDKLKLILVIKDFKFKTISVEGNLKSNLANINSKEELQTLLNHERSILITLKYFGEIVETTNCHEEQLDLTKRDLKDLITDLNKKYTLNKHDIIVAVNQERIDNLDSVILQHKDEVAILPPFAGG